MMTQQVAIDEDRRKLESMKDAAEEEKLKVQRDLDGKEKELNKARYV